MRAANRAAGYSSCALLCISAFARGWAAEHNIMIMRTLCLVFTPLQFFRSFVFFVSCCRVFVFNYTQIHLNESSESGGRVLAVAPCHVLVRLLARFPVDNDAETIIFAFALFSLSGSALVGRFVTFSSKRIGRVRCLGLSWIDMVETTLIVCRWLWDGLKKVFSFQ